MFVVVFAHNYLLGMANPKAALGPKAARAAALIGTTSGQESPCHMQNIQSQGLGSSTTPAAMFVVVCSTIGSLGMANPRRP